jgi:hypothetical protein
MRVIESSDPIVHSGKSMQSAFDSIVSLDERVKRLEHALTLSLSALQTLAVVLQTQLGPEVLGAELQRLAAVGDDTESEAVINTIDSLIREGQQPAAVRHYREAFGVTWDQALTVIGGWERCTSAERLRSLRVARFIKRLTAQGA